MSDALYNHLYVLPFGDDTGSMSSDASSSIIETAFEVFGIAPSEYERALRALHPYTIRTGSSTHDA